MLHKIKILHTVVTNKYTVITNSLQKLTKHKLIYLQKKTGAVFRGRDKQARFVNYEHYLSLSPDKMSIILFVTERDGVVQEF